MIGLTNMKKYLYVLFFIFIGGISSLYLLKVSQCNFELYTKFNIIRNTIKVSHHNYGTIHLTTYVYFDDDPALPSTPCIKDVLATIYRGDIYILKPDGRFYIPKEIGFIGKVNTCKNVDDSKWTSIEWHDNGVYFGGESIDAFIKQDYLHKSINLK